MYGDGHIHWDTAQHQYTPLHSTPLHYTTLHCIALHYTTLHCTTLHYTTLHYTTLHYTTLHYTTLHYTTLHYTTLHYTTLHYTTLHYTTLHYTTLHYTTLHYTTLHYTTLHYTTGGDFSWGVYFAWEVSCFKLTAKFTTQILGVSAKLPTLVVGTTNFSLAPSAPLCSLCILSGSGSQVLLRCGWHSVCLFRPLISLVVWRELHALCAHRAKFRYMRFHGHCFFPASRLKGGVGGVGSGSGPRWSLLGSVLKF